ncbi:MAG TPA: sensor histidine kinase, partial [Candidatus Mediterraneibacter caccavium]|nr:sensor histidine kinase [Candidatus Mediterraneibacter caccavium]
SGLEFVTQLAEESTELCTDNGYFYRICQNLVENALKYSAKGTRVFIRTSVENGEKENIRANSKKLDSTVVPGEKTAPGNARRICLEITNTSGYPMDFTKEDIVERFARGDKARSGDGNGLGLAIVSTYAKALGGEFDIKIDCDQFKACLKF